MSAQTNSKFRGISRLFQMCSVTVLILIVIGIGTGVNLVKAEGDGEKNNVQFHPLRENQRQFENSYPTQQQQQRERQRRQAEEMNLRQVRGNPTAAFQISEGKAVIKAVKKVTKLKKATKKGKKSSASSMTFNWKTFCLLPISLAFYL